MPKELHTIFFKKITTKLLQNSIRKANIAIHFWDINSPLAQLVRAADPDNYRDRSLVQAQTSKFYSPFFFVCVAFT